MTNKIIESLTEVLRQRQDADPGDSYVASLYHAGLNRILEKVGEEATEVVIAAKDAGPGLANDDLVNEVADLWFHSMVMLVHLGNDPATVLDRLAERSGTSGHEERRSREPAPPQN